jgi:formylmethanofuran dehydrogenase subunit D
MLHPEMAEQYGIQDGQDVKVTSRVGNVIIPAEAAESDSSHSSSHSKAESGSAV